MPKLEQWQIDDLLATVDLVDIVGRDVTWDTKKSKPNDMWACCPFHGEKSPSFHVQRPKQRYHCFGCGASGNAIRWMTEYRNLTFPEAIRALGGNLDASNLTQDERDRRIKESEKRRLSREASIQQRKESQTSKAVTLWARGVPIKGTLAERYLVNRGIPVRDSWSPSLRFVEKAWNEVDGIEAPALLCATTVYPSKKVVSVWRIFLDPVTGEKAKCETVKVGLGPSAGGAVRLSPSDADLGVCEGVETGHGIECLTDFKFPIWPALSTSGMKGLILPPSVERLWIYEDGDRYRYNKQGELVEPPGQTAGDKLEEIGIENGCKVFRHQAPEGQDWLNVWNTVKRDRYEQRSVHRPD